MEFLYTVWEKLQTSVSRRVFNNVILNEELEVLIKKVEDLVSLEKDMKLALDNLERQHGKKRKEEVNIWLEKVERTRNKVSEREQQVRQSRYFPQWWLQWFVRNDIREVSELFEQGKFREGLLISDEDENRGEVQDYSQEVLEDIQSEHSEGSMSPGYYWTENQSEEDSSESIPEEIDLNNRDSSEKGVLIEESPAKVQEDIQSEHFKGNISPGYYWAENQSEEESSERISEEVDLNKLDTSEKGLLTGKSAKIQVDTAEGSVQDIWKYDVFLSSSDPTRYIFACHLYEALRRHNIKAFIDRRTAFEKEQEITPFIERVIEGANLSIIVFTLEYALSSFCLDEMAMIMECRMSKGQIVIPIFYKVDSLEKIRIRVEERAEIEAAFQRAKMYGEKTKKEEINRGERWKSALSSARDLAGWYIHEYSNEADIVEQMTQCVLKQLKYPTRLDIA